MSSGCDLKKYKRDFIAWLRGDYRIFADYSRDESIELVGWLATEGVLFQLNIRDALPQDEAVKALLDDYFERNKGNARMKLRKMRDFDRAAKGNNLHYLFIKGATFSQLIYGAPWNRVFGDIDVLVDARDLMKASAVAKEVGFLQPAEGNPTRILRRSGHLNEKTASAAQANFVTRTSARAPHLAPFYSFVDDAKFVRLEIHDRFHGMDELAVRSALWSMQTVRIGNDVFPTCDDVGTSLVLILAAYDATDGLRSNIQGRSSGLKNLIDLHFWLQRFETALGPAGFAKLRTALCSLGVEGRFSVVLRNMVEIFPDASRWLEHFSRENSKWGMRYLERCLFPETRCANAIAAINRAVDCLFEAANYDDITLSAACGVERILSQFHLLASVEDEALNVNWILPRSYEAELESMIFLVTIVCGNHAEGKWGLRVAVFSSDGQWHSAIEPFDMKHFEEHVSKRSRVETKTVVHKEASGIRITTLIPPDEFKREMIVKNPLPALFFPSVHYKNYGSMYDRVLGDSAPETILKYVQMR